MAGKRYYDPSMSLVERRPGEMVGGCDQPAIMAAPHWHAQAEVNHVVRGWLLYEMHGHRVRLAPGDLALFWGGLPHRLADTAEDTLYHVYHLPLQHFFRLRLDPDLRRRLMRGAVLTTLSPQAEDGAAFARWARMLGTGEARQRDHVMDELKLRIERMGFEPGRLADPLAGGREGGAAPEASGQAVARICAFIAENFREDIASSDIARAADIHPKYAMGAFKRATGMTLGAYLSLLRVSYAQALLMEDGAGVLAVAMDAGFGSVSAFNKCFRATSGTTPSAFRREHRGAA